MKFITVILSIYVFTLSAIPCVDIDCDSTAYATVYSSEKSNHSHDKENDLCSPFCTCNCCGHQLTLTYVSQIIYDFQTQFEEIKTSNPIYTSIPHSNFYGSIWQPPQLV